MYKQKNKKQPILPTILGHVLFPPFLFLKKKHLQEGRAGQGTQTKGGAYVPSVATVSRVLKSRGNETVASQEPCATRVALQRNKSELLEEALELPDEDCGSDARNESLTFKHLDTGANDWYGTGGQGRARMHFTAIREEQGRGQLDR